jgi:hypothetical protein
MTKSSPQKSSPLVFPFDRIDGDDAKKLTPEEALERYEQYGFLWIHLPHAHAQEAKAGTSENKVFSTLKSLYQTSSESFHRKWSVENAGNYDEAELSASVIFQPEEASMTLDRFYISTILSRKKDKQCLDRLLEQCLGPYFSDGITTTTTISPPLLGDSHHQGGAWLFVGRNAISSRCKNSNNGSSEPAVKKPKRQATTSTPLVGRAEHVDDVTHSGTWHVQLSGSKTWFLRPNQEAEDWYNFDDNEEETNQDDENKPPTNVPDLRDYIGLEELAKKKKKFVSVEQSDNKQGGLVRLCCHVQQGDLFVVNTRAWYHRTELPVVEDNNNGSSNTSSNKGLSISIARDFFLQVSPVQCPKDVQEGELIWEDEDEIPENFPPCKDDHQPNCVMAEIELEEEDNGDNDNDTEKEDPETRIVLIALQDLKEGETLVLKSEQDEGASDYDDEEGEEENAPERVDPRVVATQDWEQGSIVLSGDDIPEEIPKSMNPNCRLLLEEENGSSVVIKSLRGIRKGEIYTIEPDDDDEMDDYEEAEVDLESGEIILKRKG